MRTGAHAPPACSWAAVNVGISFGDREAHMGGEVLDQRPSARARALSVAVRLWIRPMVQVWSHAPTLPWPYWTVDHLGRLARPPRGTRTTAIRLPSCRAQWIDARLDTERPQVILYLPGGAFVVGGWHLHRAFLARLSRRTNALVLAVDYRKLPRHEFGAAAEDALDAYRHLLDQGIAPDDVIVAGDSAGGFLALLLTHRAKQAGLPAPGAIIAISPLLSLVQAEGPLRSCAMFPRRALAALARFTGVDVSHDDGPMGLADRDMPPVLLHAARGETLAGQVLAYDDLLTQHGVPHETRLWPVDVHVFHAAHWLPEAAEALDSIADFIDEVASEPAPALSA